MKCKDILYDLIANARNRRLPTDVSPESNASVKIAVIKHFDCQLPVVFSKDKIYFPLHCGTATTSQKCFRDNTGDNIAAHEKAGTVSRILPLSARHWSGSSVQPRYYQQESYLAQKYPNACYTGTSSWIIGGRSPFSRRLTIFIKRTFQKFRP